MQKYQILGKKGEGTFSEVLKAQDMETRRLVAIKCMKKPFKSKEQVNRLREIQAVRRLQPHPNIVQLIEVLFDRSTGRLALVFELMEMSLYDFIRGGQHYLSEECLASYMHQLLKGLDHAHSTGIFHRDIKPENILIGADGSLKIADFGSCKGLYSKQPLTEYISTRWYRSPECLLTDGYYSYKMDLWSAGCVFFEIMALHPLFPGASELDQLHRIHSVLGTPPPDLLSKLKGMGTHIDVDFAQAKGSGFAHLVPRASKEAVHLLTKLLTYDAEMRCTAKECLQHPYFGKLQAAERSILPSRTTVNKERALHTPFGLTMDAKTSSSHSPEDSDKHPPLPRIGSPLGARSTGVAGGTFRQKTRLQSKAQLLSPQKREHEKTTFPRIQKLAD